MFGVLALLAAKVIAVGYSTEAPVIVTDKTVVVAA